MTTKKKANLKELKIRLSLEFEGEKGLETFAALIRLLSDHGFKKEVQGIVAEVIRNAKENGAAVPPELEAFINGKPTTA